MTVKVYSTPSCHWCVKVKEFLKENDIEFKDLNVAEDRQAAAQMVEISGQMGVPVVDIKGTIIVGFNEPMIKEALGLK